MVSVLISLGITILAAGYFISDCRGRLDRGKFLTGFIYLLFTLIHAVSLGISSAVMFGVKPDVGLIDDFPKKNMLYLILSFILAFPELIVSVIGMVRFIRHDRKSGMSDNHFRLSMISAALVSPLALMAAIFAALVFVKLVSYLSTGFIAILVFGLMTFFIGFVIVVLFLPFIIGYYGLMAVVSFLPVFSIMFIIGVAFCICNLIAAYDGISSAVYLCKCGKIGRKMALLYSVLSVIMFANLYALSKMKAM